MKSKYKQKKADVNQLFLFSKNIFKKDESVEAGTGRPNKRGILSLGQGVNSKRCKQSSSSLRRSKHL